MSVTAEILSVVKKIFLVSEELTRLSSDVKELSRIVNDHEVRISVIENTISRPALKTHPAGQLI